MYRGEINNGGQRGSVGLWGAFPESGLAPCAFLYAFLGIHADIEGLHIRPNLPSELEFAGVDGLMFHGQRLKIACYRTRVVIESEGGKREYELPAHGEVTLTKEMLKSGGRPSDRRDNVK